MKPKPYTGFRFSSRRNYIPYNENKRSRNGCREPTA